MYAFLLGEDMVLSNAIRVKMWQTLVWSSIPVTDFPRANVITAARRKYRAENISQINFLKREP